MKILYLIQDYLYAAFYHIGRKVFGKIGGEGFATNGYIIVSGFFIILLSLTIAYVMGWSIKFVLIPAAMFYVLFSIKYDKREKNISDADQDERYIKFLKQRLLVRLPFYIIGYMVISFIAISLLGLIYLSLFN